MLWRGFERRSPLKRSQDSNRLIVEYVEMAFCINNWVCNIGDIVQGGPEGKADGRHISPYLEVSLRCIPNLIVEHLDPIQTFYLVSEPKKIFSCALVEENWCI